MKKMVTLDLARILGAKITLEPPEIYLQVVTDRGGLLAGGPYQRVDYVVAPNGTYINIVLDSSPFWEVVADFIFELLGRFLPGRLPTPRRLEDRFPGGLAASRLNDLP